jgi:hypothetical protein
MTKVKSIKWSGHVTHMEETIKKPIYSESLKGSYYLQEHGIKGKRILENIKCS